MCYQPMKIKAVHAGAPSFQFVPCGNCDECRRMLKSSWSFRLGLEIQKCLDNGFEIGFCTLTFKPEKLPYIPRVCFLNPNEYEDVPCFDKNLARKFIRNLRTKLFDGYGITGCKYFFGSEYGERHKRPHHHFLIVYPKYTFKNGVRHGIKDTEMHSLICQLWQDNGFIFPENADGTGRGYYPSEEPKPFKVDASIGAYLCAKYVTKYVCKDIGFNRSIANYSFVTRVNQGEEVNKVNLFGLLEFDKDGYVLKETAYKVFLRCKPFHLQSRSLGWDFFANMTDKQKLDVLENGVKFLGTEKRQKLPVYIKNKLIFDNRYIYEEIQGKRKRLCRREANQFFLDNADKIFYLKCKGYEKLFDSILENSFWTSRNAIKHSRELAQGALLYLRNNYGLSNYDCAVSYLAYYMVRHDKSFYTELPVLSWLQRYTDKIELKSTPLISEVFHEDLNDCFSTIFYCLHNLPTEDSAKTKEVDEYKKRKKERCLDVENR